ncbi:MAG: sulfatase [Planctomycetia bacterium]|nr:sulfatase [Planctomycetia bacterium]
MRAKVLQQILGTLTALSMALAAHLARAADKEQEKAYPPNIIIIFADDLGYGDLGCYGHPTIRTPNLDRMAREGLRFTQFYVAECVCTPSRAALMTGRLPIRNGMCSNTRRVLFSDSTGGLQDSEITIAEALKTKKYATACVGKWHLGHLPQFLPTRHGFDSYYGIPYSNDMKPTVLMRNAQAVEDPADQDTLTERYTAEALTFIRQHRQAPFFLYLPHNFPHVPLHASSQFKGKSLRGLYGDVVEELDWSVGQILATLRELEIHERTFVFFTSDNGPWLTQNKNGGSAGLLRNGKGSTWEGGMREPAIAWWPGTIPAGGTTADLASTMDLFATIHALAGIPLATDRTLDSFDLTPLLKDQGPSPRKSFFYYRGTHLMAARMGPWKAHFMTQPGYGGPIEPTNHDPPLLFNLDEDPSEQYDAAAKNPEVIAAIRQLVSQHEAGVTAPPSQLELR